jgi:hypothetical protein
MGNEPNLSKSLSIAKQFKDLEKEVKLLVNTSNDNIPKNAEKQFKPMISPSVKNKQTSRSKVRRRVGEGIQSVNKSKSLRSLSAGALPRSGNVGIESLNSKFDHLHTDPDEDLRREVEAVETMKSILKMNDQLSQKVSLFACRSV